MTELKQIPAVDYPLFVVWDFNQNCYTFLETADLGERIFNLKTVDDEDEQVFILNIVRED